MQQDQSVDVGAIGDDIRAVFGAILSRLHIAFGILCLVMIVILAYIWVVPPLYQSRVDILVDPRQRNNVSSAVVESGLGSSAAGGDTLLLESQVQFIESHSIVDQIIRSENLLEDEEFAGKPSSGTFDFIKIPLKAIIYGPQSNYWEPKSPYDKAVEKLHRRMHVQRDRNTYVITVYVKSEDSDKAARIANAIADTYIEEVNGIASRTTRDTASLLSDKLEELKQKAAEASLAVETYRQANNLIDANETLVVEQRLDDLNRQLAQATAELQEVTARRNQFRASIQRAGAGSVRGPEIGNSDVVSQLQLDLADVESEISEFRVIFGASHPSLRRSENRRDAILASLDTEYDRIFERLDVAVKTASERVGALEAEVATLENRVASSNQDTIRLQELQSEADVRREVYASFLQRSKEAWEQVDIPTSTAQIISQAYATSKPSDPPALLLLVSGFVFGSGLGVFGALAHSVVFPRNRRAVPDEKHDASETSSTDKHRASKRMQDDGIAHAQEDVEDSKFARAEYERARRSAQNAERNTSKFGSVTNLRALP